jgi:hypothetical protein
MKPNAPRERRPASSFPLAASGYAASVRLAVGFALFEPDYAKLSRDGEGFVETVRAIGTPFAERMQA